MASTLKTPTGDIVERALFHLALRLQSSVEPYSFERDQVFDLVSDYLPGESVVFQEEVAQQLLKHPLITPSETHLSFWHPALHDYLAVRGLQEAILKQDRVEQVWPFPDEDLVYELAEILDTDHASRLVEWVLGFDPLFALECANHAKSLRDSTIAEVVSELSKAIPDIIDEFQNSEVTTADGITIHIAQDYPFLLGELFHSLSIGYVPGRLAQTPITDILVKLVNYLGAIDQTVIDYNLDPDIHIGLHLENLLRSQNPNHCMVGLCWLERILRIKEITFSPSFLSEINDWLSLLPPEVQSTEPSTRAKLTIMVARVNLELLPKIIDEQEWLTFCKDALQYPEDRQEFKFHRLLGALGLLHLKGEEALELLYSQVNHPDPQLRLVAEIGLSESGDVGSSIESSYDPNTGRTKSTIILSRQAESLINLITDPNPVVAFHATNDLYWDFDREECITSCQLYRTMIENLIAPLVGKIPEVTISEQFPYFQALRYSLYFLVDPYSYPDELKSISSTLLNLGLYYNWYVADLSDDKADKKAALLGSIIALIWVESLVSESKVQLDDDFDPEDIEKILLHIKSSNDGYPFTDGEYLLLVWGYIQFTDEDIAYIKTWTDHEITREIATKVLSGSYQPRLEKGE
jgi:hypothetical protein